MATAYPRTLQQFRKEFPEVWKAYDALRDACDRGSLDAKTSELIKIAVEVSRRRHGGLIAHIHRAQEAGAGRDDILHAIQLALPLVGFPDALEAFRIAIATLKD